MIARDNTPVSPSTPPSSRPVPGLSAVFAGRQTWIPAFAGMTVEGGVAPSGWGWCRTWAPDSAGTVDRARRAGTAGTATDRGRAV